MSTEPTDTSVVVIGGGQAGLSVSFYLKRLGLDPGNEFVVLDRGPISGGAWQHRWDALRIGSAHRINDLPGMDELGLSFENADRQAPAKNVVADYYRQYEQHYGFQVVRPAHVTSVENKGPNLLVNFHDGEKPQQVTTDIIINATGTWGSPFIPWYPGLRSFEGRHVHTTEYKSAQDFVGQKIIVVGGGTSAIGFLLELESVAGSLTWVSRRPIEFLEDGELNLEARASAVALQDEAARAGRALPSIVSGTGVPRTRRIQAGIERGVLAALPMFSSIEPNGVRWANGSFQEADVIIWSTGFRPELRHLAPLRLREKEGGIVVANGTSWKDGRIFFAGYGPQASTIGANRAGRTIARQAVATLSRLKREEREEQDALHLRLRDEQEARDAQAARDAELEAARVVAAEAAALADQQTIERAEAAAQGDSIGWAFSTGEIQPLDPGYTPEPAAERVDVPEAPEDAQPELIFVDEPLSDENIDFFGDYEDEPRAPTVDDFFGDDEPVEVGSVEAEPVTEPAEDPVSEPVEVPDTPAPEHSGSRRVTRAPGGGVAVATIEQNVTTFAVEQRADAIHTTGSREPRPTRRVSRPTGV
ncbi:NAD(P)-binding domain-containing protein [Glaciihabitans arcticus]|uniref:NAD(P)-binding domain-containing protein n=1 Tax=Glaciihabitans arcticus TaxID=2668039 RepID=UPI0018764C79|nr:NAD(P)-binding domain-containing protein [Glaciihabitans arcticus]